MNCPNCGEAIETRHLFCVICGCDLKDYLSESRLKQTVADLDAKRKKVQSVLTTPIGTPKHTNPQPQEEKTTDVKTPVVQPTEAPAAESAAIIPDFMRGYI